MMLNAMERADALLWGFASHESGHALLHYLCTGQGSSIEFNLKEGTCRTEWPPEIPASPEQGFLYHALVSAGGMEAEKLLTGASDLPNSMGDLATLAKAADRLRINYYPVQIDDIRRMCAGLLRQYQAELRRVAKEAWNRAYQRKWSRASVLDYLAAQPWLLPWLDAPLLAHPGWRHSLYARGGGAVEPLLRQMARAKR